MRAGLTIILSAFVGLLISLPGAFMLPPLLGLPFIALFTATGARIGYKRQNSDAFFYFSLVASIALLSLFMYTSFKANELPRELPTSFKIQANHGLFA